MYSKNLKMSYVKFLVILLIVFNIHYSENKCTESFATVCESVFDVIKHGRKQWTNLIIQSNNCEDATTTTEKEILKEDVLEKCPNLEELYIIERLDQIETKAFQVLKNLAYVNLYKNNLKVIPVGMFSNLENLYKIELQYNNVQSVTQGSFTNIPKLKTINLSNNQISNILDKMFNNIKNLKKLILSGNIISTIKSNSFPGNLEILNLDNNAIQQLEDRTFSNLNNLRDLILSRNKLKKLKKGMFSGLGNIFKIDVSHNSINNIEVKTFDDVKEMKLLQLAHNKLTAIKTDIFPKNNAMMLQGLRLDHNTLSFLSEAVFERLPTLRRLSIGGNPWQCVCLTQIQQEMNKRGVNYTPCDFQHYFSGGHPTCMQFKTDECVENAEFVGEDFPISYFRALQNFSYDCP